METLQSGNNLKSSSDMITKNMWLKQLIHLTSTERHGWRAQKYSDWKEFISWSEENMKE
jgi:hypothetical protein